MRIVLVTNALVREIQSCFSGLRPMPSSTVLDEDGNVCVLVEAQRDR